MVSIYTHSAHFIDEIAIEKKIQTNKQKALKSLQSTPLSILSSNFSETINSVSVICAETHHIHNNISRYPLIDYVGLLRLLQVGVLLRVLWG